ncbi:MAG TPA: hypothetical protein VHK86_08765 [Nitrososphaera sp.]|nr:hypothetical protein [Nitrososphaera sp.]
MKFRLNGTKVKYSKGEQNVFSAIGAKAKTSTQILEKVYPDGVPLNGRKIVIGMIKSLKKKMTINKEPFKLCNSELSGPHAMEFWLEGK